MIKSINIKAHLIAEGDRRIVERIVDVEPNNWFMIDEFKRELDKFLDKFGEITIPGTSD